MARIGSQGVMTAAKQVPPSNRLLANLPPKDYQGLLKNLELVDLKFGEVLYEPGEVIRHVYFPNNCLISLLTLADGHLALEVGMVGHEGMVGTPMPLGIDISPVRALVQGSGSSMRMTSRHFRQVFDRYPSLQRVLYRYIHALMAQVTQTAACNRFHVVEKRLARWLLMTLDRVAENQFLLTQEFLSHMLGVRRVGVTEAARSLQKRKLISYNRGNIRILNRAGLESYSCGCYRAVKDTYERILG